MAISIDPQTPHYDVRPLFPSLVLETRVPEYRSLVEIVYKQRDKHDGLQASNIGGWHSPIQPIPELLHKYIPFSKWKGACWYMINGFTHGNYSHTHPNNHWSGVLWIKVPSLNPAELVFEHPDRFAQFGAIQSIGDKYPDVKESYNYVPSFSYPPEEGKMLLFPASLRHHVRISQSSTDRIVLSFNLTLL